MKAGTPEYRLLHRWVEQQLGKPEKCQECKTTIAKRFEWANISGEYKKVAADWKRLCSQCHAQFDRLRNPYCGRGHLKSEENTYMNYRGERNCRPCQRHHNREYARRQRLLAKTADKQRPRTLKANINQVAHRSAGGTLWG